MLLFVICATGVHAATDVVQANLYVTDSPVGQAYGANVTAGETLVADFQLRDAQTNATLGNSLGYCILLRAAGPNQCLYTIQFASGTIQVDHTDKDAVHRTCTSKNRLLSGALSQVARDQRACAGCFTLVAAKLSRCLRLLAQLKRSFKQARSPAHNITISFCACRWPASRTPQRQLATTT